MTVYKNTTRFFLAYIFIVSTGIFVSSSFANGKCKQDKEKFCSQEKGKTSIYQCLLQNYEQLQPACKKKLQHKKKIREIFHKRCGREIQQFCSRVEPERKKLKKCLKKHKQHLSMQCKHWMKKYHKKYKKKHKYKEEDEDNHDNDEDEDHNENDED